MTNHDAPPTLEPLLNLGQVAELLGVTMSTLRRLIGRGEIEVIPIGGRRMVEPSELRRFVAAQRKHGEA